MLSSKCALILATGALVITACSTPDVTPASSSSSSSSSTTPTTPATAAGVDFPDLSSYAEGDPSIFFSGGQRYYGFAFRTHSGQKCVSNSYRSHEDTTLRCWGPRPDRGSGTWEVTTRYGSVTTMRKLPETTTSSATPDPTPILTAEHVLTYPEAQLVCGVTAEGSTACKIGDHGFVLSPTATELF